MPAAARHATVARGSPPRGCISCATPRPAAARCRDVVRRGDRRRRRRRAAAREAARRRRARSPSPTRRARCARRSGALLIVNDRPVVAREAGADGVHVGQDDMPAAEVREIVGPGHADRPLDARAGARSTRPCRHADGTPLVDYIGVGPVHETPTKPGARRSGSSSCATPPRTRACRSSRSAACTRDNLDEVLAAGARRVSCCARSPTPRTPSGGARAASAAAARGRAGQSSAAARAGAAEGARASERDERARGAAAARRGRAAARAARRDRRLRGARDRRDRRRRSPSTTSAATAARCRAALFLAVVLALLARGMYRRRYWAVLGFEALLAFQIIVTSLALVVASTLLAAAMCLRQHRARRLAVLEAGPRHGPHPGRRARIADRSPAPDRTLLR